MLEPSESSGVRDAIITDVTITERQKQVLLEHLYVVLRTERSCR